MRVLDQVRASAAATAASARCVQINREAIAQYALSLPLDEARAPELDAATHYVGHADDTLAYVLQLDAINFGSGYFPHLKKRPGMSGYFTVASSLKDLFDAEGPLSAQQLVKLTASDCARIFGQDAAADRVETAATDSRLAAHRAEAAGPDARLAADRADVAATDARLAAHRAEAAAPDSRLAAHRADVAATDSRLAADRVETAASDARLAAHRAEVAARHLTSAAAGHESRLAVAELMGLFAQALSDLGRYVGERFGGSFRALVDQADGSAEQLVAILSKEMPFYQDVGFYKRAQLTAADLSVARVASFDDLDRLTIFADNLVPHVLRLDGVLEYAPELLQRIQREELIPAGSIEEGEIRACALHAVELIAESMRQQGEQVTSMQLDYVLWNRGQAPEYKAVPRHRTRTVFY